VARQFSAGEILHFNTVRIRVAGSGNLQQYLRSLDDVHNTQLANVAMEATTNKEANTLANFKDQYSQLEIRTVAIDETFNISKIRIFIKQTATGYPQ